MRKVSFTVKKWVVRALVAVGGALGFTSCQPATTTTDRSSESTANNGSSSASISISELSEVSDVTCVYGPPPGFDSVTEPVEIDPGPEVYGPPVVVDPTEPVEIDPEQ